MYGKEAWQILQHYNLAPKKRFGQNFLIHRRTAEAVAAAGGITREETVVEVGAGLGALTLPLARLAKRVLAFEIDSGIVRFHKESGYLPENVTVIHQDILKADFAELRKNVAGSDSRGEESGGSRDQKVKIVANLPYSISNPFIFTLIDNAEYLNSVTVMLQKEVAERLTASYGSKEYGVPTILLASCATVEQKLILKPDEFYPRPKIDSMVVHIDFTHPADKALKERQYDFALFKDIVRTTFNQRRKTLANTLINISALQKIKKEDKRGAKEIVYQGLKDAGISQTARPETLSPTDFIFLSNALENSLSQL